jgi:hypothetical protein
MNMISHSADDMRGTVATLMDAAGTPQERARRLAQTLDAMLDDGRFSRLASRELVALRAVVWAAAAIADDLCEAEQRRQPQRPVRWWRR